MILFIDKVKKQIEKIYRKAVFRKSINCPHKNFIIGKNVICTNRNIVLGKNVILYPGIMFSGDGKIEIGDNVCIGKDTIIYSSKNGGVKIGNNTTIAAQCYIIDMDHGIKAGELIRNQTNTVSPIIIGEDVWIGAGVKILKGSIINNGAIIGAQSVVKGEIHENCIAFGITAKTFKKR